MLTPSLGVTLNALSISIDEDLVKAVESSKIKTLELFQGIFLKNQTETKHLIHKLSNSGIKPVSVHADYWDISAIDTEERKKAVHNIFSAIELAEEFDAEIIVVHPSLEPITPDERDIRKENTKESLRKITRKCITHGKRLALEILPRTCLGNNSNELFELAEGLPETTAGFCLDTNHLMDKPFILSDLVKILGKRLFATHLSDYDGVDEKHQVPGAGVLDWQAFMNALNEINYAGPFNFECGFNNDVTTEERIRMLEESYEKLISYSL